jgi:S1-C subfamily serine protease
VKSEKIYRFKERGLMKKVFLGLVVSLSLFLSGCFILQDSEEVSEIYLQTQLMNTRTVIRNANVGVKVDLFTEFFGGRFERTAGNSQGSGVVYASDDTYYYALTNFHVIDGEGYDRVQYSIVPSYVEVQVEAVVMAYDETFDLAIIRFEKGNLELDIIDIFNRLEKPLTRGEMVLAVGNPSSVNSIVTYGEFINHVTINDVNFNVLLHSALIYPGNSGGALTDVNGNLVGINTWRSQDSDERNLSVPLNQIHNFLSSNNLYFGLNE